MNSLRQVTVAGAFIFDSHNRIFLAKYAEKFQKTWSIPGGKIEFGETPEEAVIREVKEETNISLVAPEYFMHGAFVANGYHVVFIDYIAQCPDDCEVKINDEFSEWGFFSRDQLDTLTLIQETKDAVLKAMRQRSRQMVEHALLPYNLGLIRRTVSLQPYQDSWTVAYQWLCNKLTATLGTEHSCEFHHIGSTSIIGLVAKPIIDIMLIYSDASLFKRDIPHIEQLGFTHKGDAVGKLNHGKEVDDERHFFSFYNASEQIDYAHLHALPKGHPHIARLLGFRDHLRGSSTLLRQYEELKLSLRSSGLARHDYARAKSDFVDSVLGSDCVMPSR